MNRYPVRVEARHEEPLSRWLWLVKWILLVPHYLALLVLWTGLVVLTLVAYLAVLFTGHYPVAIRAYNLGVLRWSWRVGYYGYQVLGTDRYPPFTLADVPDYPARVRLDSTDGPPPRWLPLVAWVFAIPHLLIIGALNGAATWSPAAGDARTAAPIGVVSAALLIAGFALLFTGHYPRGLARLLIGIARWNLRVLAYLTLLTPRYPPFRLDQGGMEPDGPDGDPPPHAAHAETRSGAGSAIALVVGVMLLAPAAGAAIGGGILLAVDSRHDSTGYVTSPAVDLTSTTAAVTAEDLTITDADAWTRGISDTGGLRLNAVSSNGRSLFIGIAPQHSIDAWLSGTAHDELTGLSDGTPDYDRVPGDVLAVTDPTSQTFWVASATGPQATLEWNMVDGQYAVVVVNADGSPGVAADVRGAFQVPASAAWGGGLLALGGILAMLAIGLIVLGGWGLGLRHNGPPPPIGPVPQPIPPVTAGV
ncbi:hypothetical protein GCM10010435_42160 [Winogradskya consettensis]|uniref:DUF4389 domain-containing protein n=1 Tax=Winogradskya consettensis TaxID=113560 RepID=A0A919SSL5_9ACTN|nr:DUF4389 domain-containing protein [Actinoplanes consettensis]GIM76712.1 hypothetical protein Aco04nite_51720 [Actinoplanes consettensis]